MECAEAPTTSTLRFLRHRPSLILANQRISLLRLWLPYRVSPIHHHERPVFTAGEPTHKTARPPLRGFVPYSVFPAAQSHIPPTVPTPPVTLRPQGFSPSRRFAPRATCRAYFIPVPLLGFALRDLHPHVTPYAISDAGSLMGFQPTPKNRPAPPGVRHATRSPPKMPGG